MFAILLLVGLFLWRRKNNRIQKKYENLIEKLKSEKTFPLVVEEELEMEKNVPDELNLSEEDANDAKSKTATH